MKAVNSSSSIRDRYGAWTAVASAVAGVSMLAASVGSAAAANPKTVDEFTLNGRSVFAGVPIKPQADARTIPYFTSSFTYGGQTYPYWMVGTNPAAGPATTVIPTVIIPLRVVMANGRIFDGTADALTALRTPIFLPAPFVSGNTQYGDAVMRGEFWGIGGSNSNYHVLLGQPQFLPAVEIDVPPDKGTIEHCPCDDPLHDTAILDDHWFLNQIARVINTSGVQPEALAIVLTHRVVGQSFSGIHGVLTNSDHGGGHQKIQTYIMAELKEDANIPLGGGQFLTNTHYALASSHEVAEWLNDPFGANTVPNWISPFAPSAQSYGCSDVLEVGDPVISEIQFLGGTGTNDNSAVQDAAFFSWFSRQVPSIGINGQYSLFNSFSAPPQTCSPASRSLLQ